MPVHRWSLLREEGKESCVTIDHNIAPRCSSALTLLWWSEAILLGTDRDGGQHDINILMKHWTLDTPDIDMVTGMEVVSAFDELVDVVMMKTRGHV